MNKILIAFFFLISSVSFASGFALPDQDARAISMANAFSSVADNSGALFYNPAGITQLNKKITFNLGASLLLAKSSLTNDNGEVETNDSYPVAPEFNFVYMIMPKLYFGLGLSSPYAAKIEWPDNWEGAKMVEMMGLESVDISPTLAYEVLKGFSVALTYDLGLAGVELRKRVPLSATDYMLVKMATSEIAIAHGFKLSMLYKLNNLSTSLVFKYGKTYDFKGSASFTPSNPVFYSSVPDDQTMELSLTLPNEIIWGISYRLMSKLLLSFDFQYTMWSSYKELKFEFEKKQFDKDEDGNKTRYSTIPKNWEDVFALRFGIEYKLNEKLAFRGGYAYDVNPVPDETLDPSLPDNDRHIFAIGAGYKLNDNIGFDFAYSFVLFTERESKNEELQGTYNTHVNIFSLNTNFSF